MDYRALREGRTIELMNFFHFDGAEMTLRHITLAGVSFLDFGLYVVIEIPLVDNRLGPTV